jgi:hypothetical protein
MSKGTNILKISRDIICNYNTLIKACVSFNE